MPSDFGDTFVESYKYGTKIAQDEAQHAKAVAMEEQKLAATKAMEAAKMEALNKQIEIAEQERQDRANYQYDTTQREKRQLFEQSMLSVDPENKYVKQLKIPVFSSEQAAKQFDTYATPGKLYIDAQWGPAIVAAENIDRQLAANQRMLDKVNAPIKEAELLNEKFDEGGFPQSKTQTKQVEPGIFGQIWRGLGKVRIPLDPFEASEKIEKGTVSEEFMSGFNEPVTEQFEVAPSIDEIKTWLNTKGPIVSNMLPRAKGENFPNYASSIGTYANMAEQLLRIDENGTPSFDISGLNTKTARTALYTVAFTHRQNYLNALAEAQNEFKMAADKEEAAKKFEETMIQAKKQFPLYNETIGQSFGQKYAK